MPRTMWKGAISFGLVSIPIKVFPATEEKGLSFNQLHDEDHGRIKYQRVCAKCGEVVPFEHIVRGYEYEKDRYVVLTEEELASVPVESSRAIDILQFVDLEEIDPIYFQKSYYLVPEETGVKAYKLLEMVDKKVAGEEIEVIEAPEPTKVVDLMEALKASVEAAKKPAAAPAKRSSAKSSAKKSTAKKAAAKRKAG